VAGLLGRVLAQSQPTPDAPAPWPAPVQALAAAAERLSRAQQAEVRREAAHLQRALAPLGAPIVLLKGAAYVMANLPAAEGRVFSDVDVLLPRAVLHEAESLLTLAGWLSTNNNAYDQHYYRTWMHELPAMQHVHRQTTLDVHHNILPLTARLKPDADLLLADARPLPQHPGLFVLAPADMVLHGMAHLFMNEEVGHALRDLSDMDRLLRHFSQEPGFWDHLPRRAQALDLTRPLYHGLRATQAVLGTPVPQSALDATTQYAAPGLAAAAAHALWRAALHSPHPGAHGPFYSAATALLYLRGHWLRMPPWLLAKHLSIKAVRRSARPAPTV
jgi:hypothetical protein